MSINHAAISKEVRRNSNEGFLILLSGLRKSTTKMVLHWILGGVPTNLIKNGD